MWAWLLSLVGGAGLMAIGGHYWQAQNYQWCVRFTSTGGQEVTFSRGCRNPQRYKQWVIMAALAGRRLEV